MPQSFGNSLTEDRSTKEVYPRDYTDFHGVLSPIRTGKSGCQEGNTWNSPNSSGQKSSSTRSLSTRSSPTKSTAKEPLPKESSPRECSSRESSSKGPRPLLDESITEPFPEGMFRVPVPDQVFSDLAGMKTSALRVLLVLIRKTFRFEDRTWISSGESFTTQDLKPFCKLSRGGIRLGLSHLEDLGYVTADRSGHAHHFCLDLEVPESRFTYLPVLLFPHIGDLSGPELRLLLIVLRATWGWTCSPSEKGQAGSDASAPVHRRWASLSTSNLSGLTGCSETSVREAIQDLQGSYLQRCRPTKGAYYYRFRPSSIRGTPDATTPNSGTSSSGSSTNGSPNRACPERHRRPKKPKGPRKQKGLAGPEECSREAPSRWVVQGFFSMPLPNELAPFSKRTDPPNAYRESSFVRKAKQCARAEKPRPDRAEDVVSGSKPAVEGSSSGPAARRPEGSAHRTSAQPCHGNRSIKGGRSTKTEESSKPRSSPESTRRSEPSDGAGSKAKELLKKYSDGDLPPEDLHQQARSLGSSSSPGSRCPSDSGLPVTETDGSRREEALRRRTPRPGTPPSEGLASDQSPSSGALEESSPKATSLNSTEQDLAEKLVNAGVWRRRAVALARRFSPGRIEANFEYFREYPSSVESPGAFLNKAITQGYVLPSSPADGTPDTGRRAPAVEAQPGSCPAPGSKVKERRREALIESGRATEEDFTRCLSPNDHCRMYFYRLSQG